MKGADFIGRVGDLESLVAFYPGIDLQHRQAIQEALLYAQLRASHLYDFQENWSNWIHNYRQHLESVGFTSQGIVTGDALVIGSAEDLEQARFGIAGTAARDRLKEQVRQSFAQLGAGAAAERFFQGTLLQPRLGSFQVMPCEWGERGELLSLLCSLRLSVDQHSASGKRLILHFKGGVYRFEPPRFALKREAVRRYLMGKSHAVITRVRL